jgi:diacylglycerol kinase family enzyme
MNGPKDLAQRYSGIVIISGDGLIHEVYNGLAKALDFCFSQLAIQFWHSHRS